MPSSDDHTIHPPGRGRIGDIADALGFDFTETELADYETLVRGTLEQIEGVAETPEPSVGPGRRYHERPPGYRPDAEEDPHNAWIVKCRVEGASSGPLSGTTVGLKDTIALAGYGLTAGSTLLESFTPRIDATVVTRLLDAGATIVGKQNMESFAHSGSGDFSDFGTVTNPHDEGRLAGGSSSGSAVAVATGDCDVSIGGDQLGSIRIPSAWCGVVGLKPTFGLVPYTGVVPSELSYDHVGPMARDVERVARTLDVVAGVEQRGGVNYDPRQPQSVPAGPYVDGLEEGVDGLTVGVLEEGFGWEFSDDEVDSTVATAIDALEDAGATTMSVSVEHHRLTGPISLAILTQAQHRLRREESVGTNRSGWFWSSLADVMGSVVAKRPDDLPVSVKAASIAAEYLDDTYGVRFYAKAKNLVLAAAQEYSAHLAECDALAMPTTPMLPYERDDDLDRVGRRAGRPPNFVNTALFDFTGHPAISVPCGSVEGLPVGLMLVGEWYDERTLFKIARAVERETETDA